MFHKLKQRLAEKDMKEFSVLDEHFCLHKRQLFLLSDKADEAKQHLVAMMETHYARFDSELGSVFTSLLSTAGGRESEQFQLLSQEYSQSQQSMASVLRNESLNLQKSLDKVNALIYKYAALKAAVETFEKDDAQCAYYRTKMKGLEEMRDRAAEKGKELGEKDRERLARNSQTLLEYQCKIAQIDPILRKALADCWTHRLDAMGHLFMATITAQNDILLRLSALSKETCSSQAVTALDPQFSWDAVLEVPCEIAAFSAAAEQQSQKHRKARSSMDMSSPSVLSQSSPISKKDEGRDKDKEADVDSENEGGEKDSKKRFSIVDFSVNFGSKKGESMGECMVATGLSSLAPVSIKESGIRHFDDLYRDSHEFAQQVVQRNNALVTAFNTVATLLGLSATQTKTAPLPTASTSSSTSASSSLFPSSPCGLSISTLMQEFGHSIRQHLPNAIIHVNEPSLELQVTLANGVEVSSGDGKSSGDKERDGKERVVMVVEAGKALFMECGRARQEIDDIIAQQQAHATRAQDCSLRVSAEVKRGSLSFLKGRNATSRVEKNVKKLDALGGVLLQIKELGESMPKAALQGLASCHSVQSTQEAGRHRFSWQEYDGQGHGREVKSSPSPDAADNVVEDLFFNPFDDLEDDFSARQPTAAPIQAPKMQDDIFGMSGQSAGEAVVGDSVLTAGSGGSDAFGDFGFFDTFNVLASAPTSSRTRAHTQPSTSTSDHNYHRRKSDGGDGGDDDKNMISAANPAPVIPSRPARLSSSRNSLPSVAVPVRPARLVPSPSSSMSISSPSRERQVHQRSHSMSASTRPSSSIAPPPPRPPPRGPPPASPSHSSSNTRARSQSSIVARSNASSDKEGRSSSSQKERSPSFNLLSSLSLSLSPSDAQAVSESSPPARAPAAPLPLSPSTLSTSVPSPPVASSPALSSPSPSPSPSAAAAASLPRSLASLQIGDFRSSLKKRGSASSPSAAATAAAPLPSHLPLSNKTLHDDRKVESPHEDKRGLNAADAGGAGDDGEVEARAASGDPFAMLDDGATSIAPAPSLSSPSPFPSSFVSSSSSLSSTLRSPVRRSSATAHFISTSTSASTSRANVDARGVRNSDVRRISSTFKQQQQQGQGQQVGEGTCSDCPCSSFVPNMFKQHLCRDCRHNITKHCK